MKCFNHRELDAIAVCKHCGKALCSACMADVKGVASCKGMCESAAAATLVQAELARCNLELQVPIWNGVARFCYAMGLGMGGFGIFALINSVGIPETAFLPIGMGVVLCLSAYGFQRYARELKRKTSTNP